MCGGGLERVIVPGRRPPFSCKMVAAATGVVGRVTTVGVTVTEVTGATGGVVPPACARAA